MKLIHRLQLELVSADNPGGSIEIQSRSMSDLLLFGNDLKNKMAGLPLTGKERKYRNFPKNN